MNETQDKWDYYEKMYAEWNEWDDMSAKYRWYTVAEHERGMKFFRSKVIRGLGIKQ